MERETIKVIADILVKEMSLDSSRIFLFNDGRTLPDDDNLYVILQIVSRPPFGAKSSWIETDDGVTEVQTLNVRETITVSLISKSTAARQRAYEVQMAMNSIYSQQMQEKYGFHIAMISPVRDLSFLEETARLTRFDTEVTALVAYEKTQAVDYYNVFNVDTPTFEP